MPLHPFITAAQTAGCLQRCTNSRPSWGSLQALNTCEIAHRTLCTKALLQACCSIGYPHRKYWQQATSLPAALHVILVRHRSSGLPTYTNAPLSGPLQSVPGVCSSNTGVNPDIVTLEANSSTVHWGYYYAGTSPQLVINSGDTVNVEMVRVHHRLSSIHISLLVVKPIMQ